VIARCTGLDGLIAKRLTITYHPDLRAMLKIKHTQTATCVVVGYPVSRIAQ